MSNPSEKYILINGIRYIWLSPPFLPIAKHVWMFFSGTPCNWVVSAVLQGSRILGAILKAHSQIVLSNGSIPQDTLIRRRLLEILTSLCNHTLWPSTRPWEAGQLGTGITKYDPQRGQMLSLLLYQDGKSTYASLNNAIVKSLKLNWKNTEEPAWGENSPFIKAEQTCQDCQAQHKLD